MTNSRPIRVLLTVPHLSSTASPYREMIAIARYLPRDEFRLTICSLRKNGVEQTGPELEALGIPYLIARFRPRGRTLRHIRDSLRDQRAINAHGPFDIQHSLDFTSSPFEAVLACLQGRAYVHSQRNMNEGGNALLLRIKLSLASRIIAISDAVVGLLDSLGVPARKVRRIPLGIDLDELDGEDVSPGKPGETVLCVGNIERRKRHEDAIRAVAALSDEFPQLRLEIAGRVHQADYHEELKGLIDALGLSERVRLLGVRDDVLQLMRQASAVMLCSESEAFGWVIVEAMAVGTPVIASAVDGPRMIIQGGENGLLVPVGDVDGYAEALRRILTRPEVAKALAEEGRRTVEQRFSARAMVKQIAALYRELVR